MNDSNDTKKFVGGILLVVSTALILYISSYGEAVLPGILGSAAMLAMAAGALLVGTSEGGRPV